MLLMFVLPFFLSKATRDGTTKGLIEFLGMAIGLKDAPATYYQHVHGTPWDFHDVFCVCRLDMVWWGDSCLGL